MFFPGLTILVVFIMMVHGIGIGAATDSAEEWLMKMTSNDNDNWCFPNDHQEEIIVKPKKKSIVIDLSTMVEHAQVLNNSIGVLPSIIKKTIHDLSKIRVVESPASELDSYKSYRVYIARATATTAENVCQLKTLLVHLNILQGVMGSLAASLDDCPNEATFGILEDPAKGSWHLMTSILNSINSFNIHTFAEITEEDLDKVMDLIEDIQLVLHAIKIYEGELKIQSFHGVLRLLLDEGEQNTELMESEVSIKLKSKNNNNYLATVHYASHSEAFMYSD